MISLLKNMEFIPGQEYPIQDLPVGAVYSHPEFPDYKWKVAYVGQYNVWGYSVPNASGPSPSGYKYVIFRYMEDISSEMIDRAKRLDEG